jgi:predicted RNA-binding Zn-ribbon protein involved in translation (DUF1610 family)
MSVKCPSCEAAVDEDELVAVYDCGACGETFSRDNSADGDSNRCPSCNKFAGLSDQKACPDCGEASDEGDFEALEVWKSAGCVCDPDEIPSCEYCERDAEVIEGAGDDLYETGTSGVSCCSQDECLREHAVANWSVYAKGPATE